MTNINQLRDAAARATTWRANPQIRPQVTTARAVAIALAGRVAQLEDQLAFVCQLAVGRQVRILRGNQDRSPETGPGFGRKIPAVVVDALASANQVKCRLLTDDPDAVGAPNRAGDSGLWARSQIVIE